MKNHSNKNVTDTIPILIFGNFRLLSIRFVLYILYTKPDFWDLLR